jgi:hypothetical protein
MKTLLNLWKIHNMMIHARTINKININWSNPIVRILLNQFRKRNKTFSRLQLVKNTKQTKKIFHKHPVKNLKMTKVLSTSHWVSHCYPHYYHHHLSVWSIEIVLSILTARTNPRKFKIKKIIDLISFLVLILILSDP